MNGAADERMGHVRPWPPLARWIAPAIVAGLCWTLMSAPARSKAAGDEKRTFECPPALDVEQELRAAQVGWEVGRDRGKARLRQAIVRRVGSTGQGTGALVPATSTKEQAEVRVYGWALSRGTVRYQMECHYTETDVILTAELGTGPAACVAVLHKDTTFTGEHLVDRFGCSSGVR